MAFYIGNRWTKVLLPSQLHFTVVSGMYHLGKMYLTSSLSDKGPKIRTQVSLVTPCFRRDLGVLRNGWHENSTQELIKPSLLSEAEDSSISTF